MDRNETLLRRLEHFDANRFHDGSVGSSTTMSPYFADTIPHPPGKAPEKAWLCFQLLASPHLSRILPRVPFVEDVLEQTRVYARAQSNDCDVSSTSSAIRTNAWSALSGLSLNDISVIPTLALPISWEEVNNIGRHLTFAAILSSEGPPESTEGPNPQSFSPHERNAIGSWADAWPTRRELNCRRQMPIISTPVLQSPSNPYTHRIPSPFLRPHIQGPGGGGMMPLHQLIVLGSHSVGKSALVNQIQVRSVF